MFSSSGDQWTNGRILRQSSGSGEAEVGRPEELGGLGAEPAGDLVPGRVLQPSVGAIEAGPGLVRVVEPPVGHRQEEAVVERLPAIGRGGPLKGFEGIAIVAPRYSAAPVGPGDPGVGRSGEDVPGHPDRRDGIAELGDRAVDQEPDQVMGGRRIAAGPCGVAEQVAGTPGVGPGSRRAGIAGAACGSRAAERRNWSGHWRPGWPRGRPEIAELVLGHGGGLDMAPERISTPASRSRWARGAFR